MCLFIHFMYHFVKIWREKCIDNLAKNSNRALVYDVLPPTLEDRCRNARSGVWCRNARPGVWCRNVRPGVWCVNARLEMWCRNARPGVWWATYELTPVAWINTLSSNNQYSLETSNQ